jgi:hypothetical protein
VAETKRNFIEAYTRPVPAIYNTVLQELLVQQHFIRYGVNYQYNAVRKRICTSTGVQMHHTNELCVPHKSSGAAALTGSSLQS